MEFSWAAAISEDEWALYRSSMQAVRDAGVRFLLGGGFALAAYTGTWRDTKDIDFYILPQDRERVVQALNGAGFCDLFSKIPYDRKWIYRSTQRGVIVDIIWAMANQRAQVDPLWFDHAEEMRLRRQKLLVVPPEEFIWCKLYILQRDHCDWTDIFNVLYTNGATVNWPRLISRVGEDKPLLRAMLTAYGWLCPRNVLTLPQDLWEQLDMPTPEKWTTPANRDRIRLLDSRNWFVGHPDIGEKLEV